MQPVDWKQLQKGAFPPPGYSRPKQIISWWFLTHR